MLGRIYKLLSSQTSKVYVGSTTLELGRRLNLHKSNYKRYLNKKYHYVTSYELVKYDSCRIELMAEKNFKNKKDMYLLESYYIKRNPNCVNVNKMKIK